MTPSHQTPPTITVYVPVKASERLPEKNGFVICRNNYDAISKIYYKGNGEFYLTPLEAHKPERRIDNVYEWLEEIVSPDPSYINAIINDPGSNDDKVKRLSEYFNNFDKCKE